MIHRPRLYLAGPEVFRRDATAEGERLKAIAADCGAEGIFPLDGGDLSTAGAIKYRCLAMIDAADAVVANISPFRGHHMDPGTAFEIGYAEAKGKPVFLWSSDTVPLRARIPVASTDLVEWRDADGHAIEDFDLAENLMIAAGNGHVWPSPSLAMEAAMRQLRAERHSRLEKAKAGRRLLLVALAMLVTIVLATLLTAAQADIKVIDGDTIVLDGEHIRLVGYDTPEIRHAGCEAERRLGVLARARVTSLLQQACGPLAQAPVSGCIDLAREMDKDRYGRSLARLSIGGEDIGDILIGEGMADVYECTGLGRAARCPRRRDWCGRRT